MATVKSVGLVTSLALGLAVAAFPSMSRADTLTFALTSDHCTGGCLGTATSAGTITIMDVSSGVVNVSVSLATGFQFVNTGFDASFGFNLIGNPSITYSGLTSGFSVVGTNPQSAGSLHMDGTGFFEYGVNSAGNPSTPGGSLLSFTLTATGLSVLSFEQNAAGQFFAADVLAPNGNTGGVDASAVSRVPLPPAALLFGSALLGMTVLGRRRKKVASIA